MNIQHRTRYNQLLLSFLAFTFVIQSIFCLARDHSQGILDIKSVYKASKAITSVVYPNSDDVLVDDYILESYNPDGTGTIWDDTFIKILTEKGKKENSSLSFYFTLPYSTVEITNLEVIKSDGSVRKVDTSRQSRVMIDDSQMIANIYNPNAKILKVNIPNLQVGDIIRYVSLRKIVRVPMPDSWSDFSLFEHTSPIKHLILEVISPKQLPLKKFNLLDEIKGTVAYLGEKKKNKTVHGWIVKDVPRMFPEPNMPPLSSVVQRLLVSTIPDWQTISKWYWNLSLPHLNATNPEMKEKVEELLKGKKSDMEKIEAIYYYVSQQIRYMGITTEKDAPGFEPHDVNITFENKYGVCRDKAALLVAMLRLAGFNAYPVLVKVGPKLDKEVPMLAFNHAIASVELKPGHYILMDPTDENSRQLLPQYLCNKSFLVAKPNGETLKTTPIIPAQENLMLIRTNAELDNSGKLTAQVKLNFNGINDTAYRGFFATLTPEERELFFEKAIKQIIPSAELITLKISPDNMQNTSVPLSVNLQYMADKVMIKGDLGKGLNAKPYCYALPCAATALPCKAAQHAMIPLPWFGKTIGIINFVIGKAGLNRRKYPLVTDTTCGYKETLNIKYDNKHLNFESIPDYSLIDTPTISYNQRLSLNSNKDILQGTNILLLKVVEFTPKQYLELKDILKMLELNRKKMPILTLRATKNGTISKNDIKIINKKVDIDLKDQHNWTKKIHTTIKILSYSGKKEYSEIKIPFNPAWESIKIDKAAVIGKNGKTQNISKDETNLMDAPWTGSAPRYPAGKILVVSLPGVEVGSIIDMQITRQMKDRPFFSCIGSFRGQNPIENLEFQIKFPNKTKLQIVRKNLRNIKEEKAQAYGFITYKWTAKNQKPLKKETSLPPKWTFLPTIILSTGNWQIHSARLNKEFTVSSTIEPEITSRVNQLLKSAKTDKEKIIKIRDCVSKNIRLAGPSFVNLPLNAITPAEKTLSDGYGNSSDRAIVLYSMLKAAGFKPQFVLASEYPQNLKQITSPILNSPQYDLFKYALVKVKLDNKTIYLNDTNEYSALGTTANEYNLGLNLTYGKPMTIKPLQDKNDKIAVSYSIKLTKDGAAYIDITKKFFGNYFGRYNKKFAELKPEKRDRYFQTTVADISQSATPTSKLITNFEKYPGVEKFSVNVKNFSILDNNYCYFKSPLSLKNLLAGTKEERFYPFFQNKRVNLDYTIKMILPSEFNKKIIIPQTEKISLPNNSGVISLISETKQNQWNQNAKININPSIFSPEQYNQMLKIKQKISSPSDQTFLLKNTSIQKSPGPGFERGP